jgi:MinD superfamily P-loop ATPase
VIVAVASGKGGTGKTSIACALAQCAEGETCLLDCDVDEPNAHILLRPDISRAFPAAVLLPCVDEGKCDGCGECARVCRYHALTVLGGRPLLFEHLCHSCGGCVLACPRRAIGEKEKGIGRISVGAAGGIRFVSGELDVGEAMCPPVIRQVRAQAHGCRHVIIDSPPGTACSMVAAVRDSDFCLLVTEPTPFGLHDLSLAVEVVRKLGLPFGVVVNIADVGDGGVERYCREQGIAILARIPYDRAVAEAYSRGKTIVEAKPEYRAVFLGLWQSIRRLVEVSA